MSSQGSFSDLRLNQQSEGENFWPSFTDIMMVIVMIFLLAMVILITRNMELVHQLQSSLHAEQEATQQVQSTSQQNSQLNQRVQAAEKEANMLRLKLMDLSDEHQHSIAQLTQLQDHYTSLQHQQHQLQQEKITLTTQQQQLNQQLLDANQSYLALQHQWQSQQQDIVTFQQSHDSDLETIQKLKATYAGLEKKYQHLIRPARSSKGRFVVQVRYQKVHDTLNISIKSPQDKVFIPVSGSAMHKRLSAMKQAYPHKLYVKIIFPEHSGLSYNEAWKITESLLRMYDYYYQDTP